MKANVFTLIFCALTGISFITTAQITTSGMVWGETFPPFEPLLINENFKGFQFFHTDANANQGNSDNALDPVSGEVVYGFKQHEVEVPIIGSTSGKVKYTFYQCAFAPEWSTAYAYRDAGANDETKNTPNVTNGFVEISRPDTVYSTVPTIRGYFTVDLRAIEFVEVMQWTHSSTGGKRRGVLCEYSQDDGANWDTLRYEAGDSWAKSFSTDITSGIRTSNEYNCDPSGYGMTWEEGIYASNLMLRFTAGGAPTIQTPRIHDLKIYGTYNSTSSKEIKADDLKIYCFNKKIRISEEANLAVYNIGGVMVKSATKTKFLSMDDMPSGIYFVKAQSGSLVKTSKVLVK